MNKISVRLADWHKDNADIHRIRSAVFIAEQHVPPELEFDAEDRIAAKEANIKNKSCGVSPLKRKWRAGRPARHFVVTC